ncbi:hypothetical protein P153DRAFT_287623, partial [Dothidotthia symphoricarpi CBS 119687]
PFPAMDLNDYQKVANVDYSIPQDMMSCPDQFDRAYLSGQYPPSPQRSSSTLFDSNSFFGQPLTSTEMSSCMLSKSPTFFSPALPGTGIPVTNGHSSRGAALRQTYNPSPFIQPPHAGFTFETTTSEAFKSAYVSPITQVYSRTPSSSDDVAQRPISPTPSSRVKKRESTSSLPSPSEEPTPKRPQRKRGRPRLDRSRADTRSTASSLTSKSQRTGRLPHNQVERKYREGLNSELERLRRAVPALPQNDEGGIVGQPKPSKAMVLAGAIEYIQKLESERDALEEENKRLRRAQTRSGHVENWRKDESLDDFLVDP